MANRWWWNGVLRAVGYQGKPRQGNHFWLPLFAGNQTVYAGAPDEVSADAIARSVIFWRIAGETDAR